MLNFNSTTSAFFPCSVKLEHLIQNACVERFPPCTDSDAAFPALPWLEVVIMTIVFV